MMDNESQSGDSNAGWDELMLDMPEGGEDSLQVQDAFDAEDGGEEAPDGKKKNVGGNKARQKKHSRRKRVALKINSRGRTPSKTSRS